MKNEYILILATSALLLMAWFRPNTPQIVEGVLANRQISASSVGSLTAVMPEAPTPDLDLKSAIAVNLGNHFYFLRFNTNNRWPMASLTKLLTASSKLATEPPVPSDAKSNSPPFFATIFFFPNIPSN